MANVVGSVEFRLDKREFSDLDTLIDNLADYSNTLDDELQENASIDAENIANLLSENYRTYIQSLIPDEEQDREVEAYDRVQMTLHRTYGTPNLSIRHNDNGFEVVLRGRDVQYQEYGTGDRGASVPHPEKPSGWSYASGPNVIRDGKYVNSSYNMLPDWYKTADEMGTLDRSMAIWMAPFGPTYGLHTGRFLYDTFEEYSKGLSDYGDTEGSIITPNTPKLSARNFKISALTKITKGVK